MPDSRRNSRSYGKWSREELRQAELTAGRFLQDHSGEIAESMRAKARFLETLVQRVALKKTTFEERLDYLARISEIAAMIQEDADGFFSLAAQPVVARILGTVKQ